MTKYEFVKRWRKRNGEKVNAQARRYRAKHPDKRKAIAARYRAKYREAILAKEAQQQREWRVKNPEGQRRRMRAFKARREQKLAVLAGRPRPAICDLCGENNGGICFDHCHASGRFRGWLCDRCNKVLGLVKDDAALLLRMASHIRSEGHGGTDGKSQEENSIRKFWSSGEEGLSFGG